MIKILATALIHKQTHQHKLRACSSVQWALIGSKGVCINFISSPLQISSYTSRILVPGTGRDIPALSRPVPGFSNDPEVACLGELAEGYKIVIK